MGEFIRSYDPARAEAERNRVGATERRFSFTPDDIEAKKKAGWTEERIKAEEERITKLMNQDKAA